MRIRGPIIASMLLALSAQASAQPRAKESSAEAKACIASYEQVQALRPEGKLRRAREEAIACARGTCPELLAKECTQWLGEITASMPTVVLSAKDATGREVTAVKVSVDGAALTDQVSVIAVAVDPGRHVFRFESREHGAVDVESVLREGDKNKAVSAVFPEQKKEIAAPAVAPTATERPVPTLFWILGGTGAAAVGVGVVFEALGLVQRGELEECKPHCARDEIDTMTRDFIIGDVTIGVGAVALGAALLVYLTRPEVAVPAPVTVSIDASPDGGWLAIGGRF